MKSKIKLGYGHMDMSRSTFKEHIKGTNEISPFDLNSVRTGTHACIVDSLGGDRIPLGPTVDYSMLDVDLIYLWLQGGAPNNSIPTASLENLRKQWDGVLLINWDEIYWFTDPYVKSHVSAQLDSTMFVDAVVSGFHGDGERMKRLGFKDMVWKYLVTPYDVKWLKNKFGNVPKVLPKRLYGMCHGRASHIDRILALMTYFGKHNLQRVVNRYRFVSRKGLKRLAKRRVAGVDFSKITIIDAIEPWIEYMKYLGGSWIFIDEYPAHSQSHSTLEAACCGTPTISHRFNSSAVICFPRVLSDMKNIQEWIDNTKRLLLDEVFYNEIRDYAFDAVEHYSIENFYQQLLSLYEDLK